jgi:catechol 2,3-dioxygenase
MATHQAGISHPRGLGHVNLWVDDLARSERFYNEQCGLTVEFTGPDLIATFLGTGQTPHDLGMIQTTNGIDRFGRDGILQLPGSIGQHVGLNHLAWELENEVDLVAGYKRLQAHAIRTDMTVDHQVAASTCSTQMVTTMNSIATPCRIGVRCYTVRWILLLAIGIP